MYIRVVLKYRKKIFATEFFNLNSLNDIHIVSYITKKVGIDSRYLRCLT